MPENNSGFVEVIKRSVFESHDKLMAEHGIPRPHIFRGIVAPSNLVAKLRRYVEHREQPGDFLCAVLANDLFDACAKADPENLAVLPALAGYCYWEIPSPCWGSKDKVLAWLAGGM